MSEVGISPRSSENPSHVCVLASAACSLVRVDPTLPLRPGVARNGTERACFLYQVCQELLEPLEPLEPLESLEPPEPLAVRTGLPTVCVFSDA